jgi:hypothetical protein
LFLAEVFRFPTQLFTPPDFLCPYNQFVRFSKTKKKRRRRKKREEEKKRRKRGTQTGGYHVCGCVTQDAQGCAPAASCSPLLCFSFASLPLLHICTLFRAALITCLALSFNLALLFDCANPCFECSLPRTPHSPTMSRICFSRQSLLQSFTGSTCSLQLTPVCLVRMDKNLITALL